MYKLITTVYLNDGLLHSLGFGAEAPPNCAPPRHSPST